MEKTDRQQHIEYWRASGQSKKAYCELAGIKYPTFMSWFKKLDKEQVGEFIKLEKSTLPNRLEIVFPNGIHLYSSVSLTSDLIKTLLSV